MCHVAAKTDQSISHPNQIGYVVSTFAASRGTDRTGTAMVKKLVRVQITDGPFSDTAGHNFNFRENELRQPLLYASQRVRRRFLASGMHPQHC